MTEVQEIIKQLKSSGMSYRSIGAAIGKKSGTISRIAKGITKGDRLLTQLSKLLDMSPNNAHVMYAYTPPTLSPAEKLHHAKMDEWKRMGGLPDNLPDGLHLFRPRKSYEAGPYIATSRNSELRSYFPAYAESPETYNDYLEELEHEREQAEQAKVQKKKTANKQRAAARRETMRKKKTEETIVAGVVAIGIAGLLALLKVLVMR